jgi:hypothetical protein
MAELGIEVGQRSANPLVAVVDRGGRVAWQAQGVADWSGVLAAVEAVSR